ncbi:DUF6443 domain-containing protein [uncultured Bacteroides sp.]|uniref:DUF6443 domain-containing protein n=1 Tax=uncultured Bacteroides sp. TaxID=162156 RepID=UPI002AAB58B8|nr:DUF6443 domain-containing protein [uncultured Bacteroides sp.]
MRLDKLNIRLSKYRLFIILSLLLFLVVTQYSYAQSTTQNYILSRTMTDSTGTKYMDLIQYYDGLGRPIQKVQKAFTPSGKDLVTIQEYDDYGRESNLWLPTPYSGNGNYSDPAIILSESISLYADNSPYSSVIYENSPLNRVMQKYGPGNSWRDARRCVRDTFYTNNCSDTLRCAYYHVTSDNQLVRSGNYDDSQLYVTRTMDEDYHKTFEFKDKLGQLVLTRQINNNQNHDTYYVYDDLGNKCFVLPPIAADSLTENKVYPNSDGILNRYAYIYKYDFRNRCVWKKLPGAEGINMIYDKADHLIYTQDGEQCKRGEWTFNIPDVFNRTVITGLCSDTIPVKNMAISCNFVDGTSGFLNTGYQLSNQINFATRLLKVEYYDNYNYMHLLPDTLQSKFGYVALNDYSRQYVNTNSGISAKGMHTGSKVFMLEDASKAIITAMYYDSRGQLAQSRSTNHLGGYEYDWYSYTFTGKVDKHRHDHSGLANVKEVSRNYYDQAERLIKTTHSLNDATFIILTENTYDEFGHLQVKKQNENREITTYNYNIRNWLTNIKNDNKFTQHLFYNESLNGNIPFFNGDIGSISWSVDSIVRKYNFNYDHLNRLISAVYSEDKDRDNSISVEYDNQPNYSTEYAYDKHGNITKMSRYGELALMSKMIPPSLGVKGSGWRTVDLRNYDKIDELTFFYNGNCLIKADDSATDFLNYGTFNFSNGSNEGIEYKYDYNGDLTEDHNKKITKIEYNLLNLPSKLQFSEGHITEYLYDAAGVKRRVKQVTTTENLLVPMGSMLPVPANKVAVNTQTDYCGNVIYENGTLSRILLDGGYITMDGTIPTYHYYIQDHQGNNRVVFNQNGTVEQTNHYYPFGMTFSEGIDNSDNRYKYNGKELDRMHGLDLYDYGARYYDAAIGRWGVIDPLAEKCYSISPYVYCNNNPVRFIDPNGKWSWDEIKKKLSSKMDQAENYVVTKAKEATKSLNKVVEKITGAPLVSKTITLTKTNRSVILKTRLGDRITIDPSISKTIGKANGLINLDVATNTDDEKTMTVTTKLGGSVSASSNGVIGVGKSLGNFEAHIGLGLGVGLGEYNWGGSYTKDGNTSGYDINVRPGGGALIGVATGAAIVTTGGSVAPVAGMAF